MSTIDTDDVVSILHYFKELEDPRSHVNRLHLLEDLIVICIMAVIAGSEGPKAIGVWAESNADWLKRTLTLPAGLPSHDTIGRLLALLKPAAFQECFQAWIESLRGDRDLAQQEIIAIDGKALRRSHDKRRGLGPLFLVSAWALARRHQSWAVGYGREIERNHGNSRAFGQDRRQRCDCYHRRRGVPKRDRRQDRGWRRRLSVGIERQSKVAASGRGGLLQGAPDERLCRHRCSPI